jgi:hypothetical protein
MASLANGENQYVLILSGWEALSPVWVAGPGYLAGGGEQAQPQSVGAGSSPSLFHAYPQLWSASSLQSKHSSHQAAPNSVPNIMKGLNP